MGLINSFKNDSTIVKIELDKEKYLVDEEINATIHIGAIKDLSKIKEILLTIEIEPENKAISFSKFYEKTILKGGIPLGKKITKNITIKIPYNICNYKGKLFSIKPILRVSLKKNIFQSIKFDVPLIIEPKPVNKDFKLNIKKDELDLSNRFVKYFVYLLVAVFFIILLPFIVIYGIYRFFFWIKVSKLDFSLKKYQFILGEKIPYIITFNSKVNFKVNSIYLELIGKETYTKGSGKNSKTYTHIIYNEKIKLKENETIFRGKNKLVGNIELPLKLKDGQFVPTTISNNIIWTVKLYFDIPWWPDYSESANIELYSYYKNSNSEDIN